jgi:hypothetical protein
MDWIYFFYFQNKKAEQPDKGSSATMMLAARLSL